MEIPKVAINRDLVESLIKLGVECINKSELDKAKDYFSKSIEMAKSINDTSLIADSFVNLGVVNEKTGNFDDAIKNYREALKINPDYIEAHNNLGALFYKLKKYSDAEKEYREALKINPDYIEAHTNLAILLEELNRPEEAEEEYKAMVEVVDRPIRYKYRKIHDKYYSIVPITIRKGTKRVWVIAYVDTGAQHTILQQSIAMGLGIDIKKGRIKHFFTEYGRENIYFHDLYIHIAGKKLKVPIGFSDKLKSNIIGRSILNEFKITLDARERVTTFA